MAVSKDIVLRFIESVVRSEVLEDSFAGFYTNYDETKTNHSHNNGLKRMLAVGANQDPDMIVKHYVTMMAQVKSTRKFNLLFEMLRGFVQQNNLLGKAVCEALLTCDKLRYHDQNLWLKSFNLISEILPTLDYKAVRDILKQLLEIIFSLPQKFDKSVSPQLDVLYSTVASILDKNASLLPAYLTLDELQKRITQGSSPVWKFADLFYYFIESFKPTAQIVSIVNRSNLLPVIGCSTTQGNHSWRLDPISAKFILKGLLPYRDELKVPQVDHLRYILKQPYSRETLSNILNLKSSTRCPELIEQIAITIVQAMRSSDSSSINSMDASVNENLFEWLHLSSNLLFFVVLHHSALSLLVDSIVTKIRTGNNLKERDHLMWAFLQYITADVQSISIHDLSPVMRLFDVLYPERIPIPVPNTDEPASTHSLSAASIWIYLVRKAESENIRLSRPIPPALQAHYEYLVNIPPIKETGARVSYREAIYSNLHCFNKAIYPISNFVDCLTKVDPELNPDPTQSLPLSVKLLDTLTAHSKKSLLHAISHRIGLIASKSQNKYILTPALIETYSRLLIYTDVESFGLKQLMNSIMGGQNAVWRNHAWNIYHVLLDMYNHRVHHVPIIYKVQLLIQLHSLPSITYSFNLTQLCMTMEATELKLLLDLTCIEAINMPLSVPREKTDKFAKQLVSDSEELNKVLVLVLAKTSHIMSTELHSQGFLEDIFSEVINVTPLSWPKATLDFFPVTIKEFFLKHMPPKDDKAQLRPAVEEEYRKWNSMLSNEKNLIAHFMQPNSPPLFICILWKILVNNEPLNPAVYHILDGIRLKVLSMHARTFVDYLVYEFSNSCGGQHVNKYAEVLSDMIWKYQIISLDRLLLCMCLRNFDDKEMQVCFFIILLLLKISDFKSMLSNFIRMYSPEHWKDNPNCYSSHKEFQSRYPQKYYVDYLAEMNVQTNSTTLPTYFSTTCLRFIPVFDLLIHRALELRMCVTNSAIKIETLLDDLGGIYKFHSKPLTYLYSTLHYYDAKLDVSLKRKLTSVIVSAFDDVKPSNWCLSEPYIQYIKSCSDATRREQPVADWVPNQQYYRQLIGRLVDVLKDKPVFPHTDWRFNEFSNVKAHAVYATTIELMSLPQPSNVVANNILDIIMTGHIYLEKSSIPEWMNAIGLVMTNLPPSYLNVLHAKIVEGMQSPLLKNPNHTKDIFHIMNFCDNHERMNESKIGYLVGLAHAVWNHANIGQIYSLPTVFQRDIKPIVSTESQFIFLCCLIGPFLSRMERSRMLMDVAVELYEILSKVDSSSELLHLNTICDFLYHIKYMFTGDAVKNEIEACIKKFKPRLQYCLRFLTHLSISPDQQKTI